MDTNDKFEPIISLYAPDQGRNIFQVGLLENPEKSRNQYLIRLSTFGRFFGANKSEMV